MISYKFSNFSSKLGVSWQIFFASHESINKIRSYGMDHFPILSHGRKSFLMVEGRG